MRWFDVVLTGSVMAVVALDPWVRSWGYVAIGVLAAVAVPYGLVLAPTRRIWPLLVFTAWGAAWAFMSWFDLLPDAWTVAFVPEVIPRQVAYLGLFYPLMLAFFALWVRALTAGWEVRVIGVVAMASVVGRLVWAAAGGLGPFGMLSSAGNLVVGGLGNSRLPVLMGLGYMLLRLSSKGPLGVAASFLAAGSVVFLMVSQYAEPNLQNLLAVLLICLVQLHCPKKITVIASLICVVVVYTASSFYVQELYLVDHNSGYRVVTAKHAITGAVESYGLGVGYGKEVVKIYLPELGVARTDIADTERELVVQGVHNSFAEELMRLGLVGGVAIAIFFLFTIAPFYARNGLERRFAVCVYWLILLALLLNVGLESPTYFVGIAFASGYLLSVRSIAAPNRASGRRLGC